MQSLLSFWEGRGGKVAWRDGLQLASSERQGLLWLHYNRCREKSNSILVGLRLYYIEEYIVSKKHWKNKIRYLGKLNEGFFRLLT